VRVATRNILVPLRSCKLTGKKREKERGRRERGGTWEKRKSKKGEERKGKES
jgi:hypothetical protein